MAEFQVVMKQAQRMCKSYKSRCERCAFGQSDGCPFYLFRRYMKSFDFNEVEHIVMDWVDKHPEPKYPSYHEAWKQLFPHSEHAPCPLTFGGRCKPERCGTSFCQQCMNRPMHADVAEKLGIKPIGGMSDA